MPKPKRRLGVQLRVFLSALGKLLGLIVVGTLGYVLIEDLPALEALYMTVITLSTVGFGEVKLLSDAGRAFTIALILGGGGVALYLLAQMAQTVVETKLRDLITGRDMKDQIEVLRNHIIVVGFGRFGRIVVEELRRNDVDIVVIERDPAKQLELERYGVPFLIGSALSDEILKAAGIERAETIVIGTGSDPDNVFITLSARQLNPRLRIHSRAETDEAVGRLGMAGADQVVSAYQLGGQRMVTSILRPAVIDFLEIARPRFGQEVDLEEIRVAAGSKLAGQTIRSIEDQIDRLRIVALKHGDDRIQLAPSDSDGVRDGDHLVVIGERASLQILSRDASA